MPRMMCVTPISRYSRSLPTACSGVPQSMLARASSMVIARRAAMSASMPSTFEGSVDRTGGRLTHFSIASKSRPTVWQCPRSTSSLCFITSGGPKAFQVSA